MHFSRFLLLFVAFIVLTSCLIEVLDYVEAAKNEDKKKKSSKKKKNKKKKTAKKEEKGGKKYVEIVDLFLDLARGYCSTLGPLIEKPKGKFSWKRRCDVYYEAVELFIIGFSDTMIKELDLTQQQMVNQAQKPMRMMELKGALKGVAKRALESDKTDEKKLQMHLNSKLSQWVMNVAVNKDSTGGSINLGGGGGDLLFGAANPDKITQDDIKWSEQVSADDYVDDAEKDDPDYIHKASRGAGAGGLPNMPGGVPGAGEEVNSDT